MASLILRYAVMNAGKSTHLLITRHSYVQHHGRVLVLTSAIDDRNGVGRITSRLGIHADAIALRDQDDLFEIVSAALADGPLAAILMDEVQFMSCDHVRQAARVVDELDLTVTAYGLKNNVFGELFSESMATMLALADEIEELRTTCHCGSKANMILRYRPDGSVEKSGSVVEVGGNDRYVSVCRKHWHEGDIGPGCRAGISGIGTIAA